MKCSLSAKAFFMYDHLFRTLTANISASYSNHGKFGISLSCLVLICEGQRKEKRLKSKDLTCMAVELQDSDTA